MEIKLWHAVLEGILNKNIVEKKVHPTLNFSTLFFLNVIAFLSFKKLFQIVSTVMKQFLIYPLDWSSTILQ